MKKMIVCNWMCVLIIFCRALYCSEVFEERETIQYVSDSIRGTITTVHVREHLKTGKPYIVITKAEASEEEKSKPEQRKSEKVSRPDYRMLSPKVKSGEIPYEGPYSDRRKVYILAGSLIATGIATGVLAATAPATTVTAGAASASGAGAGVYTTAGTAVGVTSVSAALLKARSEPNQEDFIHKADTDLLELHILEEQPGEGNL